MGSAHGSAPTDRGADPGLPGCLDVVPRTRFRCDRGNLCSSGSSNCRSDRRARAVVALVAEAHHMDLCGKVAVITGGKRIGRVVARELAACGMDLVLSYR